MSRLVSKHSSLYKKAGCTSPRTDRAPLKVSQFKSFISRREGSSLMNNSGHLLPRAQSEDSSVQCVRVLGLIFLRGLEYFKHRYCLKQFASFCSILIVPSTSVLLKEGDKVIDSITVSSSQSKQISPASHFINIYKHIKKRRKIKMTKKCLPK